MNEIRVIMVSWAQASPLLADSKVSSPDRFLRLEQKTDDKQRRLMIIGDGLSFL
jgi:hypothetical protein